MPTHTPGPAPREDPAALDKPRTNEPDGSPPPRPQNRSADTDAKSNRNPQPLEEVPAAQDASRLATPHEAGTAPSAADLSVTHPPKPDVTVPEEDDRKGLRRKPFEPSAKHWWLAFAVPVAVSVVSSVATLIITHHDSQQNASKPPTNTIVLPTISGAPAQPNTPNDATACEVSRDNFAGWGPDRPVVSGPIPLPYPSLNSDIDTPYSGDERNFFRVKDAANQEAGGWSNEIDDVTVGKQYLLQFYVHNSGANGDYTNARDVHAIVPLPSCRSRQISVHGLLRSSNAFPALIWGGVNLSGPHDFALRYMPDTTKIYSNAFPNGLPVPGTDILQSQGVAVGPAKLDGVVPGGFGSSFYLTITVEAVDQQ